MKGGTEGPVHTEEIRKANLRGDDREAVRDEGRELKRLGGKGVVGQGRLEDVLGIEDQTHGAEKDEGMARGTVNLRPNQEGVD